MKKVWTLTDKLKLKSLQNMDAVTIGSEYARYIRETGAEPRSYNAIIKALRWINDLKNINPYLFRHPPKAFQTRGQRDKFRFLKELADHLENEKQSKKKYSYKQIPEAVPTYEYVIEAEEEKQAGIFVSWRFPGSLKKFKDNYLGILAILNFIAFSYNLYFDNPEIAGINLLFAVWTSIIHELRNPKSAIKANSKK